jgi:outer membrane receptor protein involved in Fe transport
MRSRFLSLRSVALGWLLLAAAAGAQSPNGSVTGTVYDSQTGRPIAGVSIAVNGQSSPRQITGSDGHFSISLSAGTYTLGFSAPNYTAVTLNSVVVKAGEATEASCVMSNRSLVTTIEVVEKATPLGATAEAALAERKLAPVISDSISHQEIQAGVASDAAGALEKVTGVSIVGEGFVYVRGLGERYSATQLNGALIPTTEPEKRVVPLDLFPSGLIESLSIAKTYSPDLPAEFAGGLVQMHTIDFPARRTFTLSTKTGFNTATTFDSFQTYPGGAYDFFGFDDGTRSIPSGIPRNQRLYPGQFTPGQLQDFGRSFADNWQPVPVGSARPGLDWSAVGGGTFGRFGVVGAVTFDNRPQRQSEFQRYLRQGGDAPVIFTEYPEFQSYAEQARLGAILNTAIRLTPSQKLVFRNTVTHEGEKTAREFAGYDGGVDSSIASQRLRWLERTLLSTGVEGDHSVANWHNSLFHWQFTYSRSARHEPDLREVFRGELPDGRYIFSAFGSSGIRFFSDLSDRIYEPQADYGIPFFKGSLTGLFKVGFRATVRSRDFEARRFRFIPQQAGTLDLFLPSNQLFAPDNIRPGGFQVIEFTRGTDTYAANMNIYAGYGMVDLGLGAKWRIVGGIRIESADQIVRTIDNLIPNAQPVTASLQNTDPAPSVNVIYALSARQNLRFSYSRTLSRPDFRELSPFDFNDVLGGFVTQGNPRLKRATINNLDARWERFLTGNQVMAVSVFAKNFNHPIEQTILPSNDLRQTFVNAQGARNIGFELEYRRSLASLTPKLRAFGVSSNFTFVDSKVDINPADATLLTSQSRPLLGQSRYICNVITEWLNPRWHSDARFYVNYVSRRISDVGTFGLPDIYQEANTFLDFIYRYSPGETSKWSLRFEAENLGNNRYRWTQGDILQRQYQLGRTFQAGVSYTFF